jgi:hypothetical protein
MSKEVDNISKESSPGPTGVLSQHLLGETEKRTRDTSLMTRAVPAKVRAAYLGNTSVHHRRCVDTSGEVGRPQPQV